VRCLVLSVYNYSFADKADSSRQVTGAKVSYICPAHIDRGGTRGMEPVTLTTSAEIGRSFGPLPGWYDLEVSVRGSQGKADLVGVDLVEACPISTPPKQAVRAA
jgi:hypothetical protein